MSTQGTVERHGLPDWDRWRLASSDRGVVLMHDLWREQIERVQEGLDPIGIVRGDAADQIYPIPGDIRHVTWEEGMQLIEMTLDERIARRQSILARGAARLSS
jgi:hypothetical protein